MQRRESIISAVARRIVKRIAAAYPVRILSLRLYLLNMLLTLPFATRDAQKDLSFTSERAQTISCVNNVYVSVYN